MSTPQPPAPLLMSITPEFVQQPNQHLQYPHTSNQPYTQNNFNLHHTYAPNQPYNFPFHNTNVQNPNFQFHNQQVQHVPPPNVTVNNPHLQNPNFRGYNQPIQPPNFPLHNQHIDQTPNFMSHNNQHSQPLNFASHNQHDQSPNFVSQNQHNQPAYWYHPPGGFHSVPSGNQMPPQWNHPASNQQPTYNQSSYPNNPASTFTDFQQPSMIQAPHFYAPGATNSIVNLVNPPATVEATLEAIGTVASEITNTGTNKIVVNENVVMIEVDDEQVIVQVQNDEEVELFVDNKRDGDLPPIGATPFCLLGPLIIDIKGYKSKCEAEKAQGKQGGKVEKKRSTSSKKTGCLFEMSLNYRAATD
ncbi:hypothetical protein DFH28DRAFT_1131538 [Melampsora americana]|nr:hypothetical protein DFH28DRAFT_1131538 [Melampsora americana]